MNRQTGAIAVAVVCAVVLTMWAAPASGLTAGYMAISSPEGSGVQDEHTGYGPGWIALTFQTNGRPHGPVTGYLFHDGVAMANGNDHFDVFSYFTEPAASVDTPFAIGWAYGNFNGCTWSYLDHQGAELSGQGSNRASGCTPPDHTTKIFCSDQATDPLCNAGHTSHEPEAGVWKVTAEHLATINPGGCYVFGNVGAEAIYNGAVAAPANYISLVNSGTVKVRYVTKRDDWVMASLASDASPPLAYKLHWGFFPRSCLTAV